MWYKLTIVDNQIIIRNLQSEDIVMATVYVSENCPDDFREVIKPFIIDFEETVKLPVIDGSYKIKIDRIVDNVVIDTGEYIYPYYRMLLASIINDLEYFLCGCNCKDCDNCTKDEKYALSIMLKSFSYYTLLYKYYPRFYDVVFKCMNCSILDINNCILRNEKFLGVAQNEDLLEKILSSFYLSFYYAEYYNAENDTAKELINKKFKYDKLIKCIKTTNADINCITNQITNNMGIFQVTFDAYINKPPLEVGDYSTTAGNRATLVLTPAMFTTLTVPAYSDPEGDAAQAVRIDSLATNGATLMLGSNPVTVGQIITMTTIAGGTLTLQGPNQDLIAVSTFNFSVRDVGSMQFTS